MKVGAEDLEKVVQVVSAFDRGQEAVVHVVSGLVVANNPALAALLPLLEPVINKAIDAAQEAWNNDDPDHANALGAFFHWLGHALRI